jgi:hypothetical protein
MAFSGFPNCPRPQVPASHFSQLLLSTDSVVKFKSNSKLCYDQWLVGQSVLVSSPHLGPKTRFLLLLDSCRFVNVQHPLLQEARSVIYDCCWLLSVQSFSDPSPKGLMTIFYPLRFETPPTWMARSLNIYPLRTGLPSYSPKHWFPFLSPPTSCKAIVKVFNLPPRRADSVELLALII